MSKHYVEFKVGELFRLKSTSSGIDGNKLNTTEGEIPYVTRSVNENGIKQYVTDEQIARKNQDKGNVITIGLDTQTAYYQPVSFFTGQNVHILDHEKMSQKLAMYLIPQLIKIMKKYSWGGNGATLGRLREDTITLPITDASVDTDSPEPDWEYMENYIKEIEQKYLETVEQYNRRNEEILDALHPDYPGEAPEAYDYVEFRVGDLFDVNNLAYFDIKDVLEGNGKPLVSTRTTQNGYQFFSSEEDKKVHKGNVITLSAHSAQFFYQPIDFISVSHMYSIAHEKMNRKIGMYLVSAFSKLTSKQFNFSQKLTGKRFSDMNISLPITPDEEPDWGFMEDYISFIEGGEKKNRKLRATKEERILKKLIVNH